MKHTLLIAVHGVVYAGFALLLFPKGAVLQMLVLGTLLIWISCVDFAVFEIPDLASTLLVLSGLIFGWVAGVPAIVLIGSAIVWGAIFAGVSVVARRVMGRDALGLGDAKLMAGVGAWLGLVAPIYVVLAASLAGIGTILGLSLIRKERISEISGKAIAFGPFLCLSTWVIWLSEAGV